MKNILTFDVEEWFDANYPKVELPKDDLKKSRLTEEIREILDLCAQFNAKATFFVLGRVAQEKPHLVREIKGAGHEIASHGFEHKLVYKLSPQEFEKDLSKSLETLERITGEKVLGYRAPSWSLNENTAFVYSILAQKGLKYSSSVFPIKTSLYGLAESPRFPYLFGDGEQKILEIPSSTIRFSGKNIPFAGGAYFRLLPSWIIKKGIKRLNKEGQPAIVYLHPRELDNSSPKLELPFFESFIHYSGVSGTKRKLVGILKEFEFGNIKDEILPKYNL